MHTQSAESGGLAYRLSVSGGIVIIVIIVIVIVIIIIIVIVRNEVLSNGNELQALVLASRPARRRQPATSALVPRPPMA